MINPNLLDPRCWRDWAACLNGDTELFFNTAGPDATVDQAKRICARCPVRLECLTVALNNREPYGVWGGKTPEERRGLLRQLGRPSWQGHYR